MLTTHVWEAVVEPLVRKLHASHLVQVGCGDGSLAHELLKYCSENGGRLQSIDRWPAFDVSAVEKDHGARFTFHRALALNALGRIEQMDLVILGGDPNWYTVFNTLKLIDKHANKRGGSFPCVLVQNVGWPHARRDAYLDPAVIPEAFRQPYKKKGMVPGESELAEQGGIFADRNNAIYANKLRNGVLTAVEDFLRTHDQLAWLSFPAYQGIGLLYPRQLAASHEGFASWLAALALSPAAFALMEQIELDRLLAEIDRGKVAALANERLARIGQIERQLKQDTETLQQQYNEALKALDTANQTLAERTNALATASENIEGAEKIRHQQELELTERIDALTAERDQVARATLELRLQLQGLQVELAESRSDAERKLAATTSEVERKLVETEGRTAKAAFETAKLRSEVAALRQTLDERIRRIKDLEATRGKLQKDLKQLVGWLERMSQDIEKHLHSWTWRIGALALAPLKRLMGQRRLAVEQLRVFQIIKAYSAWKTNAK